MDSGHDAPPRPAVQSGQHHPCHIHLRAGRRLFYLHDRRTTLRAHLPPPDARCLQAGHSALSAHHVRGHGRAHSGATSRPSLAGCHHHRGDGLRGGRHLRATAFRVSVAHASRCALALDTAHHPGQRPPHPPPLGRSLDLGAPNAMLLSGRCRNGTHPLVHPFEKTACPSLLFSDRNAAPGQCSRVVGAPTTIAPRCPHLYSRRPAGGGDRSSSLAAPALVGGSLAAGFRSSSCASGRCPRLGPTHRGRAADGQRLPSRPAHAHDDARSDGRHGCRMEVGVAPRGRCRHAATVTLWRSLCPTRTGCCDLWRALFSHSPKCAVPTGRTSRLAASNGAHGSRFHLGRLPNLCLSGEWTRRAGAT